MNESRNYMKWFCRALLVILASLMTFITTRQQYNFAHWIPHQFLREIGVPYRYVLAGEQHADLALHLLGAACLVWLLWGAKLPSFNVAANSQKTTLSPLNATLLVIALCLLVEVVQFQIGRGAESSDLLLGILGSFMAYLGIYKN